MTTLVMHRSDTSDYEEKFWDLASWSWMALWFEEGIATHHTNRFASPHETISYSISRYDGWVVNEFSHIEYFINSS